MKNTLKKFLCLLLSLLLLASTGIMASAASLMTLSAGNTEFAIPTVSVPALQDGVINANEYGYSEPIRLTVGNGLWADESVTEGLPEYVDLYMARNGDGVHVAVGVKLSKLNTAALTALNLTESAVSGALATPEYKQDVGFRFTTFLGFGEDAEKGATTTFNLFYNDYTKRSDKSYTHRKYFETRVTELTANGGERLYSIDNAYEYPLPNWGNVDSTNKGTYTYVYEVKLSIEDSVMASGLEWNGEIPDQTNFAFDLGIYDADGNETGKVHFNRPQGDETVPSLDLKGSDSNLTSISIPGAIDMTPAFNPSVTHYTIILPEGETGVVEATTSDPKASFAVEGMENAKPYDDFDLTVYGVAQNGAKGTPYTLHITHKLKYTTYVATGSSLASVMEEIKAVKEWGAGDAIEIQLFGNYVETSEVLLNAPTIFRKGGTRLPITINGFGSSSIEFAADTIYSANTITFKGLKLKGEGSLYAGSGNLTFDNSQFEDNTKVNVFADAYTEAAFIGWSGGNYKTIATADGILNTTVSFLAGSTHPASEDAILAAVGSSELKKADIAIKIDAAKLNPKLVIDGATVSKAAARVGTLPVPTVEVLLNSGSVGRLTGDGKAGDFIGFRVFDGDIVLNVTGGEVTEFIRPLDGNATRGNTEINISGEPVIASVLASEDAKVHGNSTLNIAGGTFNGSVEGSTAELSTKNNITGGTFNGVFYGLGDGGSRRVINNVKSAVFNKEYYGGHKSSGNIRGVSNTIDGAIFKAQAFGGSRSGTIFGNVINKIVSGTFSLGFCGGNQSGNIELGISNTVLDGTFSDARAFGGGSEGGTVGGDIVNNIKGGTFTGFFGACAVDYEKDGGSFKAAGYTDFVLKGDVINNVTGGTFANRAGYGLAFIGGSRQGRIVGGVINNLANITLSSRFNGGSYGDDGDASTYDIGLNKYGESITNHITSGTFKGSSGYYHFAGSLGSTHEGNINSVIDGGTFSKPYYFGNRSNEDKVDFVGTINGGIFNDIVAGGCISGSYYYQNSNITINGGTFKKEVYAGGAGANKYESATLNINGGTFLGEIIPGSVTEDNSNGISTINLTYGNKVSFATLPAKRNVREVVNLKLDLKTSQALNLTTPMLFGEANCADGTILSVTFPSEMKAGTPYFAIPTTEKDHVQFSGNDAVVTIDADDGITYYMITGADGTSPLFGKTALFVGDSISAGYGDTNKRAWAERIAANTGLISTKRAVSGTSVSDVRKPKQGIIVNQLMPKADFDFVMLHGMTNDAYSLSMSKMGALTASVNDTDFDTGTFAGGLENLIYTAKTLYPNSTIAYLINFQIPCSDKGTVADMSQHVAMIKEACAKWDIPYLDMCNTDSLNEALDLGNSTTNRADTLHPNDAGYEIITPYIQNFMLELAQ